MDQYSSSLVDTSLDLTIGVTRMRVEEDPPVRFSQILHSPHVQKFSIIMELFNLVSHHYVLYTYIFQFGWF